MIDDIILRAECDECQKKFEIEEFSSYQCGECLNKKINHEEIGEALIYLARNNDYLWENNQGYDGFNSEGELEMFLRGTKYGFTNALFWFADYFGVETVKLFEEKIGHNLQYLFKVDVEE